MGKVRRHRQSLATVLGALGVIAALMAVVAGGAQAEKGGNSEDAKKCQKGGWNNYVRSDGTAFTSEGECTSYAAKGGQLEPKSAWTNVGPTLFDLLSPDRPPYVQGTDYKVMPGSSSGDVTATLVVIDVVLGTAPTNSYPVDTSTSGCEQVDYDAAGFQAGDIALVQRGTCTLQRKVDLAVLNGASAVIIFNEGQSGRTDADFGTLLSSTNTPVLAASYAVGYELTNLFLAGHVSAHVITNTSYS